MMPFNESELIKRVYDLKIPSISAIGHETDYTLLDLVCDLRAPTPTAAEQPDPTLEYKLLFDITSDQQKSGVRLFRCILKVFNLTVSFNVWSLPLLC